MMDPTTEVKVTIKVYDDDALEKKCTVWLEGEDYKSIWTVGESVEEALNKLAIIVNTIDQFKINRKYSHTEKPETKISFSSTMDDKLSISGYDYSGSVTLGNEGSYDDCSTDRPTQMDKITKCKCK